MWNTVSPAILEGEGHDSDPGVVYIASKTLAEKAAWKYMDENKPHFDLVTCIPTLVLGVSI